MMLKVDKSQVFYIYPTFRTEGLQFAMDKDFLQSFEGG